MLGPILMKPLWYWSQNLFHANASIHKQSCISSWKVSGLLLEVHNYVLANWGSCNKVSQQAELLPVMVPYTAFTLSSLMHANTDISLLPWINTVITHLDSLWWELLFKYSKISDCKLEEGYRSTIFLSTLHVKCSKDSCRLSL